MRNSPVGHHIGEHVDIVEVIIWAYLVCHNLFAVRFVLGQPVTKWKRLLESFFFFQKCQCERTAMTRLWEHPQLSWEISCNLIERTAATGLREQLKNSCCIQWRKSFKHYHYDKLKNIAFTKGGPRFPIAHALRPIAITLQTHMPSVRQEMKIWVPDRNGKSVWMASLREAIIIQNL